MTEYIDILDETGKPTGEKKTKVEVHEKGYWHRTVHIWLLNSKGELLIQRRSPDKDSYPNLWDISTAGHLSAGEDSLAAAIREAAEELDVKLTESDFEYLFTVKSSAVTNQGTYFNNEFQDVYLVRIDREASELKFQLEEVSEAKFVPFAELEKMISGNPDEFVAHDEEYKRLFGILRERL